jgi:di/tricarboxylate transporter
MDELPKFNIQQKISLIGLLAMIVSVVGFKLDVGYVSFTVALILILCKTANEKEAIKLVPWSILIMVGGVNVLMYVVQQLGGIKLLADILSSFMNGTTAAPIMGLTAGIMALFSSGNGVVIPTLIPTIPGIIAKVGDANVHEMVLAITSCAIFTASPLTEAGGLIMATYTQGKQVSEKEQNSLFLKLFLVTFAMIGILVVATLLGVFRPFH